MGKIESPSHIHQHYDVLRFERHADAADAHTQPAAYIACPTTQQRQQREATEKQNVPGKYEVVAKQLVAQRTGHFVPREMLVNTENALRVQKAAELVSCVTDTASRSNAGEPAHPHGECPAGIVIATSCRNTTQITTIDELGEIDHPESSSKTAAKTV
jgi:hypothetical protein